MAYSDKGRRPFRLCASAALTLVMTGCGKAGNAASPPPAPIPVHGTLAFPGAEGYGAASRGGRGGQIIPVTTLADGGPGSLRACVDANHPRICVFRVAGVIRFTQRPPVIRTPYLTIAGQTAPGGGVTIAHAGGDTGRTPLLIRTHDVVVRDIRIRNDREGEHRGSEDTITIYDSRDVIVDHVSTSWARDELINGYGDNDRITISNSIFAEGIPRHDKCALLASDPIGPQRLSFIGNICAHNGDRNPDLNFPPGSCVEITNNIFYNAQSEFAEIWESFGGVPVSLIGNSFIGGRNTAMHTVGISRNREGSRGHARVYLWDNRFDGEFTHVSPLIAAVQTDQPTCPMTVSAMPADKAYERVLGNAGAFPRDAFDEKIVSDVRRRRGRIVKQPGNIPPIAQAEPYPDADGDGMDDRWEAAHHADPRRFDAWGGVDAAGMTNLDRFLADMHARISAQGPMS